MKTYRENYIRKAEIAQLVILHQLYSQSGSHELIFQGGTALRWCYGGSRFSEDLDFVTPLDAGKISSLLKRTFTAIEREMTPHFGPGTLSTTDKTARDTALKLSIDYRPATARDKISVKLEFERIKKDVRPLTRNFVLSALPGVAYLLAAGDFKVPRPHAVLVTETAEEILSDKVRALLERRYLKGRDIFDVWHLRTTLHATLERAMVEKKFAMYDWPFKALRNFAFFTNPQPKEQQQMKEAISHDLSRFLPPEVLAVHRMDEYASFLDTLKSLFVELSERGITLT